MIRLRLAYVAPAGITLLLAAGCPRTVAPEPASRTATDDTAPQSFAAKGRFRVINSTGLPATLHYSEAHRRAWLDIQASDDYRSWAIFDWSAAAPVGYIGNDHQCYSLALTADGFPRARDLLARFDIAADSAGVAIDKLPQGLSGTQNLFIIQDDEAVVVFEAEQMENRTPADPPKIDASTCQPMKQILQGVAAVRTAPGTDQAGDGVGSAMAANEPESRLGRNYSYKFHGAGYHWLEYQGQVFEQTKAQYDQAVKDCTEEGPDTCKPYWVAGGAFGRYGRYCGDGWGTGRGAAVSSIDYCCMLHDGQSWDRSGSFGHEARNLCGFAACLTCKYYVSLPDWESNFKGDFWASSAIHAFVSAGIAAVWCHPLSSITGFTCE